MCFIAIGEVKNISTVKAHGLEADVLPWQVSNVRPLFSLGVLYHTCFLIIIITMKKYLRMATSISWNVVNNTEGVVTKRTNTKSKILMISARAHQLSGSTVRWSHIILPGVGAWETFQWSENIFLETEDSGLPCLTRLKSCRHLQCLGRNFVEQINQMNYLLSWMVKTHKLVSKLKSWNTEITVW